MEYSDSALAVFQKTMDTILQGLDSVISYIDDILGIAKSYAEHLERIESVLQQLKQHGVQVWKEN